LDLTGPNDAYAIRFQNEVDTNWSDWLPILPRLAVPSTLTSDAELLPGTEQHQLEGYRTGENHFRMGWILSPDSGTKTVTAQFLTSTGVTETVSRQILASYEDIVYTVDFFADSEFTQKLPIYNGMPVVSTVSLTDGTTIEANDVSSIVIREKVLTTIYVQVTFADPKALASKLSLNSLPQFATLGEINFDVLQQGRIRHKGLSLTAISGSVYHGSFPVTTSDGYLSKDGLGVVLVNIPNPCDPSPGIDNPSCDNPPPLTPQNIQVQQVLATNAKVVTQERFFQLYNPDVNCTFTPSACTVNAQPPLAAIEPPPKCSAS